MKEHGKMSIIFLSLALVVVTAYGSWAAAGKGGPRGGPPPEAYKACEGKSEGDTAEMTGPDGRTMTGTCMMQGDRLVMRPDRPEPGSRSGRDRPKPPPEAYKACEGKSEGDTAEMTGPDGRTMTGTCMMQGDTLVLRPDRSGPPPSGNRGDRPGN